MLFAAPSESGQSNPLVARMFHMLDHVCGLVVLSMSIGKYNIRGERDEVPSGVVS